MDILKYEQEFFGSVKVECFFVISIMRIFED